MILLALKNFLNLPALNLNQYPLYKISNIINKYIFKIQPEVIFIPSGNDIMKIIK